MLDYFLCSGLGLVAASNNKLLGGILLIVGTSLGGGMLALPISNAELGFVHSSLLLIICWLIMTLGALLILEVNLRLPKGSNMVSMAASTLGTPGKIAAWVSYLFLLYTLLSSYIAGGSDVFNHFLKVAHINLPAGVSITLFTIFFGAIVYSGIRSVDYVNRGLMFGKLGVYLLLVLLISPHVSLQNLTAQGNWHITGALMILIASFGFASIVPSLRSYFDDDIQSLRKVIIYGSLIPLVCYILWDLAIMGVIASQGEHGLYSLITSQHSTTDLTIALQQAVNSSWISGFFGFFTSICMLTAFLGVSLGLFDFLADGLNLEKSGIQGKTLFGLTFVPPMAIVLFNPGIYIKAFSFAGIFCVILLLLLPTLMAWRGRYHLQLESNYFVPGGRVTLSFVGIASIALLILAIYQV
jgi:tyrosine-specific transport protein